MQFNVRNNTGPGLSVSEYVESKCIRQSLNSSSDVYFFAIKSFNSSGIVLFLHSILYTSNPNYQIHGHDRYQFWTPSCNAHTGWTALYICASTSSRGICAVIAASSNWEFGKRYNL